MAPTLQKQVEQLAEHMRDLERIIDPYQVETGGGGGGGGGRVWVTATSKAGLPDASTQKITMLGRVVDPTHADADDGKTYEINAAGTEWLPGNRWV